MRTVLLLGAGASAASKFQLPTMSSFFDRGFLDAFPNLRKFLYWFYGDRETSAWNLEEVMGYLELQRTREAIWIYEGTGDDLGSERIYQQLHRYIDSRLKIDETHCLLHERLFRQLSERDTIITMNYDLVADQTLRELEPADANGYFHQDSRLGKINALLGRPNLWYEPPPSLLPRESSRGFYLKLHGSLDWLYCTTLGCYNNTNLFCRGTNISREGQEEGRACRYCGAALRVLIVPPVARKHIEDRGRLAFLWHLAWRELIETDRIIVAGLSLPPTDFELRWLLRYACQVRRKPIGELAVVNNTEGHWAIVRGTFSGEVAVAHYYRSFSDFLDGKPAA